MSARDVTPPMTVGALRELLAQYPAEMALIMDGCDCCDSEIRSAYVRGVTAPELHLSQWDAK